jgi:hypothetical protein
MPLLLYKSSTTAVEYIHRHSCNRERPSCKTLRIHPSCLVTRVPWLLSPTLSARLPRFSSLEGATNDHLATFCSNPQSSPPHLFRPTKLHLSALHERRFLVRPSLNPILPSPDT